MLDGRGVWCGAKGLWRILVVAALIVALALLLGRVERGQAEVAAPNTDEEVVYFDPNHVIHVYDPNPTSVVLQVAWSSLEGGWDRLAVGDVTGDGDAEIVAIRPEGEGGRLTIFDPVAQDSPDDQVELLNGIPWAILYTLELPAAPRLVALGEFDLTRPGKEIFYTHAASDEEDRFVVLRSTGAGAPGRDWEEQRAWTVEGHWTAVDTGNVHVDDALDEIALANFSAGELALYRVEPNVVRTFTRVNRDHRWTDVAVGQFVAVNNDGAEIAAVRDADFPLASTWVFRYNGSAFVDQVGEVIVPSPHLAFFVNLRNAVDEELVLLREVQQELGPRPRLILRDGSGNDQLAMAEDLLDGDNEYKGAAGGDLDGDGNGELVLVRNNRIRIYAEPETSTKYELIERATNGRTVEVGNVDAAGFARRSRIFLSQDEVSAVLQPGQLGTPVEITVQDVTKGAILSFAVVVQGSQDWVTVSQPDTLTPATFAVTLSAEGIAPGEYSGQLLIDVASDNLDADNVAVDLSLRVASLLTAAPASVDFLYYPCTEPLAARQQSVSLSASGAFTFTAQIEGNPNWVAVTPDSGVLPVSVEVSVDPALRPADNVALDLLVTLDTPQLSGVVERVPIFFMCAAQQTHLPRIVR